MIHSDPHPLAGRTVKLIGPYLGPLEGAAYRIEDWWDRGGQGSWMWCQGNPACLLYAFRGFGQIPPPPRDDEVVYGKVGGLGHLIHTSELGAIVPEVK